MALISNLHICPRLVAILSFVNMERCNTSSGRTPILILPKEGLDRFKIHSQPSVTVLINRNQNITGKVDSGGLRPHYSKNLCCKLFSVFIWFILSRGFHQQISGVSQSFSETLFEVYRLRFIDHCFWQAARGKQKPAWQTLLRFP